jgi:hypothetical protein
VRGAIERHLPRERLDMMNIRGEQKKLQIERMLDRYIDEHDPPGTPTASSGTVLAFPSKTEPSLPAVSELDASGDRAWFDDHPGRSFRARIAAEYAARLASRQRHCYVYENIGPGYHLLLDDDDGGLILVEQVIDFETAEWLARLANQELATERRKAKRRAGP